MLCSGGLDSAVAARVMADAYDVTLLLIEYGCRAQEAERLRVKALGTALSMPVQVITTQGLAGVASGLTHLGIVRCASLEGKEAWVPARNLLLVSIATAHAVTNNMRAIGIGNVADGIYPDNKPAFVTRFNDLMLYAVGMAPPLVVAPVGKLTKMEVVRLGADLGVPFDLTWSCYHGGELHCGECGSCLSRKRAFRNADVRDPVQYATP